MIVVLDTNVLVSALISHHSDSVPARVVQRVHESAQIATSQPMLAELRRILIAKFGWSPDRAAYTIARLHDRAMIIDLPNQTRICRDPKDDMFLECAALAHARLLITGDADLLAVHVHANAEIITPAEYLKLPST